MKTKSIFSANINPETQIAYGVASLSSLQDWVYGEFINKGRDLTFEYAFADARDEWSLSNPALDDTSPEYEDFCQSFSDHYECDNHEYELEIDGMQLALSSLGGASLVWVFESPRVTDTCAECSICCPNAGNLDSAGHYTAYTLPADWFRP